MASSAVSFSESSVVKAIRIARPKPNKWLVTVSITFGTLMGAIDSSIVAVALPHMMGTLGATVQEITWISTGYIIANVVVMPLTAFLGRLFGQKRVYMLCLALFLAGSVLCGTAHTLPALLVYRAIQGLRRRRAAADRAGHLAADVPPEGAGDGDGPLRHGRHARPGRRPDARRVDRRQLLVAVDLLHQHPGRAPRPRDGGRVRPRGRGDRRQEPRARRGPAQEHRLVGHRADGRRALLAAVRPRRRAAGRLVPVASSSWPRRSWPSWSSRRSSSAS